MTRRSLMENEPVKASASGSDAQNEGLGRSRSPRLGWLIVGLAALIGTEAVGFIVSWWRPEIDQRRLTLVHPQSGRESEVGQAYLLYIEAPGYRARGYLQHNAAGYRGEGLALHRRAGVVRVLFLGGSTTYGEGVDNPADAYPAQVGRQLNEARLGSEVEVLNAGVRGGTSGQILTHYLLKYRYFQPDLVVINPGGNDPGGYNPRYQPDESNWRRPDGPEHPLPGYTRWLLHSRALGALAVLLFFPDEVAGTSFIHEGQSTPARWFEPTAAGRVQLDENAFYRNLSTLVREIRQDGAGVFLLSYQGNPFHETDQRIWRRAYDYDEKVLSLVAREQGVAFAPFPLSAIAKDMWVDASHLDRRGEEVKARYVTRQILATVRPFLTAGRRAQTVRAPFPPLELSEPW